jgi:hypothetical protein
MTDLNKDGLKAGALVSEAEFAKVIGEKRKKAKVEAKAKAEAEAKKAVKK